MEIQLTPEELSLDLTEKLQESEQAIQYLEHNFGKNNVPPEAYEIVSILRRAIYAEEMLKQQENQSLEMANRELSEKTKYNTDYPIG